MGVMPYHRFKVGQTVVAPYEGRDLHTQSLTESILPSHAGRSPDGVARRYGGACCIVGSSGDEVPYSPFLTARQSIRVDLDTRPGDDFAATDIAAKCVHRFVSAGRQGPRAIEAGIDCSTGAIAQIADGVPTAIGTVILSLSRNGPMRPRMKASLASKASSVATSARSKVEPVHAETSGIVT